MTFIFLGFMMKVVGEFIHEVGHASFVMILGGKVTGMSISVEWPFTLSHTRWELPNPSNLQVALVSIGGILLDVMASMTGQIVLRTRKNIGQTATIALFWMSFWTYLSTVVYLVMGAFYPFGDVQDLMGAMPVPRLLVGASGVVLLISFTYSLSMILRDIFSSVLSSERASEAVSYFWALLHMFFVSITIVKYGMPLPPAVTATVLAMILVWSYFSARWLLAIISQTRGTPVKSKLSISSRQRSRALAADDETRSRKLRLGYVVLFSASLFSLLFTGYMVNQYLTTYSLVMRTGIEIEVAGFELGDGDPTLNLSVNLVNPNRDDLKLSRIEFEVHLNQKYMDRQLLRQIPKVPADSEVAFHHAITLPTDRMFTINQALEEGRWEWRIIGSGYVESLFGETLLRFKTDTSRPPQ